MAKKSAVRKTGGKMSDLTEPVQKSESAFGGFVTRASMPKVEGVIVKSMAPMIKPSLWPKHEGRNMVLVGIIGSCFKSGEWKDNASNTRFGTGVTITPAGATVGVSLPVTATLRTGLDITGDGKDAKSAFEGRTVEIELLDAKIPSKKGNDAWHFIAGIHPEESNRLK
jgi:hypothetical protein